MYAGHGQRCKDPDLAIVYEQVRTGTPVLLIPVVLHKPIHALLIKTIRSVREAGDGCIVQHDKGRAPGCPLQGVTIAVEGIGFKGQSDNGFPGWHKDK